MWRDLDAMRKAASRIDDRLDHDRAVEQARDTVLPDGCSANTYLNKVNTIVVEHLSLSLAHIHVHTRARSL